MKCIDFCFVELLFIWSDCGDEYQIFSLCLFWVLWLLNFLWEFWYEDRCVCIGEIILIILLRSAKVISSNNNNSTQFSPEFSTNLKKITLKSFNLDWIFKFHYGFCSKNIIEVGRLLKRLPTLGTYSNYFQRQTPTETASNPSEPRIFITDILENVIINSWEPTQ